MATISPSSSTAANLPTPSPGIQGADVLIQHIDVGIMADYYDMPDLAALAKSKLQYGLIKLSSAHALPKVLNYVFQENYNVEFQGMVARAAGRHIKALISLPEFIDLGDMSECAMAILKEITSDKHLPHLTPTNLVSQKGTPPCPQCRKPTLCAAQITSNVEQKARVPSLVVKIFCTRCDSGQGNSISEWNDSQTQSSLQYNLQARRFANMPAPPTGSGRT